MVNAMTKGPRKIPLNKEAKKLLRKQRKAFIKKFGREPGEGDPIFFDPNAPGPEPVLLDEQKVRADILEGMKAAGLPPQLIFAYAKTGLLVMEGMEHMADPDDLAEYNAAIDEYFALEAQKKGG